MALQPIEVNVHIGRNPNPKAEGPVVIQNDWIRDLRVFINVDGVVMTNAELNEFTAIAMTYQPTSGESAMYSGTIDGDSVLFPATFGQTIVGLVKGSVQLYTPDGRASTASFTMEVVGDLAGAKYVPPAHDQTLIEQIIFNGPGIIDESAAAGIGARESEEAAYVAEGVALAAAQVADASSVNANSKAGYATEQGDYAKAQGQYANTEGNFAHEKGVFAQTEANRAITATTGADAARDAATAKTVEVDGFLNDSRVTFTGDQAARGTTFTQSQAGRAADYATFKTDADAKVAAVAQERSATEQVRMATEAERLAIRNQQSAFEGPVNARVSAVETKATSAEDIAKLAKARADLIIGQSGTSSTEQVDSRLGADLVARGTSGELIREIHAQQLESARQTTVLSTGVAVVSGGVDALVDVEIEGRTLISLGNSNLEAGKQYVGADKKTKVVTDGVTYSGVAKFTKGTTTVSTANFVGKVIGVTTANPHVYKTTVTASTLTTLLPPSSGGFVERDGNQISTLSGSIHTPSTSITGAMSEALFSFDIIAEIERKLGIIPKTTLAEKVQWVRDNVETLTAKWHGFGSSVGGSKASVTYWKNGTAWEVFAGWSHTNGAVTPITINFNSSALMAAGVNTDGFIHFLAYAEPSDGVVASSVSTDYIDLVITLKATAQLNTRPTIIRVENFEGKVMGSVVENAHVVKYTAKSTLFAPSAFTAENTQLHYDRAKTLDGALYTVSQSVSGDISQQLFSFNLIEAVERNIGRIPRSTVADKVQWIKDNVSRLTANWHGFGSSVGGNRADFTFWAGTLWHASTSNHTNPTVTKASRNVTSSMSTAVDANGFAHFIAYAVASDGTTPSTINTDYIDLEIELLPTADFTRPKVALYEVSAENYPKILVDWNADEVVNRYPIVEGTQHLQGVGVVAEGENLLPPFMELSVKHLNATVKAPYELELIPTAVAQTSAFNLNLTQGQQYTLSLTQNAIFQILSRTDNTFSTIKTILVNNSTAQSVTFTADSQFVSIVFTNLVGSVGGIVNFKNPMLTLGNVPKPFVPRNPSYLYADVKLGAIGTARDTLYEQDGAKFVRKVVEKDVVLDGSLSWGGSLDAINYKIYSFTIATLTDSFTAGLTTKHDGKILKPISATYSGGDETFYHYATDKFHITASDTDTGFGETFVPSVAEIKAYFCGWKMNNGTFGTNYESTGTKTWIPIGDLNNARAVTVVPTAPSPTQVDGTIQPYKLSYVLATPQVVNVTNLVEGQLKVNGLTQVSVESGIVRREKVIPTFNAGDNTYKINITSLPASLTKSKVEKFIALYKNGVRDFKFAVVRSTNLTNGMERITMQVADYDATALYEVTYLTEKPTYTTNPTDVRLRYANNLRSSLEDTVGKVQDHATMLSVYEKAIIDLYIRVKALGG